MTELTRFDLPQDRMPTSWFNIMPSIVQAGMQPLPPLHPATKEPVGPADLLALFPESLILQEVSTDQWIDIPGEVLDVYRLWRPSPLQRAVRLERALQTPARIYYKYEGVSPAGSHKPNTAVAQAYYNKEAGTKRIATETGAGQWGSAMAMACAFFGLDCQVFMVKASYDQKPYRRIFMETFGAEVAASPSPTTQAGKKILEEDPDSTGSLGIAISEAVETAATSGGSIKYALGSVLNHVLLHQTVIGLEAKAQMELAGDTPDVVIGCVGGGSNYAGLAYPFMADRLSGSTPAMRFLATEPAACPTLTKGTFAYDFGDTAGMAPIVPMYTLGHTFVPAPVHAGGLRYHGDAPSLSLLVHAGHMEAAAYTQNDVFEAAIQFAKTEGIVAAPEAAHAIRGAINEAIAARDANEERVILFNLSGHGAFDMQAYDDYLHGRLPEIEFDPAAEENALKHLPDVPPIARSSASGAVGLRVEVEVPRRELRGLLDQQGVAVGVEVHAVGRADLADLRAVAVERAVSAVGRGERVPGVEVVDVRELIGDALEDRVLLLDEGPPALVAHVRQPDPDHVRARRWWRSSRIARRAPGSARPSRTCRHLARASPSGYSSPWLSFSPIITRIRSGSARSTIVCICAIQLK